MEIISIDRILFNKTVKFLNFIPNKIILQNYELKK